MAIVKAKITSQEDDGQTLDLEFDASINETHTTTATITKHPIEPSLTEAGGTIVDNVRREPFTLAMNCVISGTPLDTTGPKTIRESEGFNFSVFEGADPGRVQDAYQELRSAMNSGLILVAQTSLAFYTDMLLTSVGITRDKDTGQALFMDLSFQQIDIVSSGTRAIPKRLQKARVPVKELGKKSKTAAGAANAAKAEDTGSTLFRGLSR